MFTNFYIYLNPDLFLTLYVSKKNQRILYDCLKKRFND